MLNGGQEGAVKQGEMFCTHSTCQANHLGLTTGLHSEIVLPWFFQRSFNSPSDAEISGQSVLTQVFTPLTRVVPLWHKALWEIAKSPLTSLPSYLKDADHKPVGKTRTFHWADEYILTGRNTNVNVHHAERGMALSFKTEHSKRMSKNLWGAWKAEGCWC